MTRDPDKPSRFTRLRNDYERTLLERDLAREALVEAMRELGERRKEIRQLKGIIAAVNSVVDSQSPFGEDVEAAPLRAALNG